MIRLFKNIRNTLYRKSITTDYPFNNIVEILFLKDGVSDNIKDKIMLPLFTSRKWAQVTGTGLRITNNIVKAHAGILKIISQNNTGASFKIELSRH